MKTLFQSLAISFSMYSRIPVPQVSWNEKNSRYVILFFPIIGLIIGGLEALALFVGRLLSFPVLVTALLLMAVPLLVTGGIHADGFLDTSDARSSFGDREKRLAILKDPHVGAFGVIRFAVYLLILLGALVLALDREPQEILFVIPVFVLSRTLSGLSVVFFPCAKAEGTLYVFSGEGVKKKVRLIMLLEFVGAAAALMLLSPFTGGLILAGNLLMFLYYDRMAKRDFGGITGDLAGWFLCMAELVSAVMTAVSFILRDVVPVML